MLAVLLTEFRVHCRTKKQQTKASTKTCCFRYNWPKYLHRGLLCSESLNWTVVARKWCWVANWGVNPAGRAVVAPKRSIRRATVRLSLIESYVQQKHVTICHKKSLESNWELGNKRLIRCTSQNGRFGEFARSFDRSMPQFEEQLDCDVQQKLQNTWSCQKWRTYAAISPREVNRYEREFGGRKGGNVRRAAAKTKGSSWRMLTKDGKTL
jgi:hypothetical protein